VADIQIPVDLGFTEFVTTLLSEVLRSVVAAQGEQEERRRELLDVADLSVDEFASQHVTDDDVDAWLAEVLPSGDPERTHEAVRGAPYVPGGRGEAESPPFAELLGVELTREMFDEERGTLLEEGEAALRAAARRLLAERQLQVVRDLAERGLPRVVVDAGRITAKLTFEALQYRDQEEVARAQEAEGEAAASEGPLGAPILRTFRPTIMAGRLPHLQHTTVVPEALRDVRLRVRTADPRAPSSPTARANVYGEVELTFRSVT
jgi:hypothetical protein